MRPYKEDERALYKTITRQVLFSDPELAGELRYFEVAPGGFSTLERHEHMHARTDPARAAGTAWSATRCSIARHPRPRHGAADDLASVPRHQGRTARLPLHGQCERDKPQLPSAEDVARLRDNPAIAAFLDDKPHDRQHDRPGALERRRARRRDRHAQPPRGEQRLQRRADRRAARGARRAGRARRPARRRAQGQRQAFPGRRRPQMDQQRPQRIAARRTCASRARPPKPCSGSTSAPVPTVALVQGGCFGGGTGIVAACDVVLAADNAMFSIAEVRWGLHAAIIIPQLADAIGVRQLRRYALTGERFDAEEACRIGLVHQVVPLAELEAEGARIVDHLLANGPDAIAETKAWILRSAWSDFDETDVRRAGREPRGEAPVGRGRRGARLVRREARRQVAQGLTGRPSRSVLGFRKSLTGNANAPYRGPRRLAHLRHAGGTGRGREGASFDIEQSEFLCIVGPSRLRQVDPAQSDRRVPHADRRRDPHRRQAGERPRARPRRRVPGFRAAFSRGAPRSATSPSGWR